jgi:hypothetical protein
MEQQQPERRQTGFSLSPRVIIIGLVLVAALFFLTRGNQQQSNSPTVRDPVAQDNFPAQSAAGVELGRIFSALSLDRDGCPVDVTTDFIATDPIYIATEQSFIPQGTAIFVRLYYGDRAIEDTDEIVAPSDLTSCVNFVFENQRGFDPGDYEAEFYVNGTPSGSVAFSVR